MSARARRSSPGKAVAALAVLGLGAWTCWRGLAPTPAGAVDDPSIAVVDPDDEGDGGPVSQGGSLGDLLLAVGSYRPGGGAVTAFRPTVGAPALPSPAPAGETGAPLPAGEVVPMHVTFVMVGGELSRACVDGDIVGIGGSVKAGTVIAIHRDGIEVRSPRGQLFYDFVDPRPRGHREGTEARPSSAKHLEEEPK